MLLALTVAAGVFIALLILTRRQQRKLIACSMSSLLQDALVLRGVLSLGVWGIALLSALGCIAILGQTLADHSLPENIWWLRIAVPALLCLAGVTGTLAERRLYGMTKAVPSFQEFLPNYKKMAVRFQVLKWLLVGTSIWWWLTNLNLMLVVS